MKELLSSSSTHDDASAIELAQESSLATTVTTTGSSLTDDTNARARESKDRYSYVLNTRYAIKDHDGRQTKEWDGTNQGATNSDSSDYKPTITFDKEYPVEYNCQGVVQDRKSSTRLL